MSTNPFESGVFYQGQFVTEQPRFQFLNPLRDQRQCLRMEIEAIQQTSLLVISSLINTNVYYYLDGLGNLFSQHSIDLYADPFDTRWIYIGGSQPPTYLVLIDENGGFHYVTSTFDATPNLVSISTIPSSLLRRSQFFGRYIELLAEDGHSVYRMSVNSSDVVSFNFERDEPWRTESICLQSGHPHLYYDGRTWTESLIRLGDVESQVPFTDLGYGGVTIPRIGAVEISLHSGFYDFLTGQDWDSRDFTIYLGSTDEPPATWPILLRGKTESHTYNENTITLNIADAGLLLDRTFQENTYAGTGGLEGPEELEGKPKPILLGTVPLLEPVPVDQNLWIYQFHDGSAHSEGAIFQGGVPLFSNLGDFPGGLENWQPTSSEVANGSYRTDLNAGMFRLAAPPGGRVTLRFPFGETALPRNPTISEIIQWIANRRLSDVPLDINSFIAHESFLSMQIGIYIENEKSVQSLFNELVVPAGSAVGLSLTGNIFIKTLHKDTPVAHIMEDDILDGTFSRNAPPKPGRIYKFGYLRSYVLLNESDLLGAALPNIRALGLEEYRYYIEGPFSNPVDRRFPSARTKIVPTHCNSSVDIRTFGRYFAYREQAFRDVFSFTVKDYSWQFQIGDNILLQHSRFGLDVPRQCVIVGIIERSPTADADSESGENHTTLTCLG